MSRTAKAAFALTACSLLVACGDDSEPSPDTSADVADTTVADTTDAGEDTQTDTPVDAVTVTCGTDSPEALAACVEESRYLEHLNRTAIVRPTGSAGAADVRGYIEETLEALGYDVTLDASVGQGVNVIARLEGTGASDEIVAISAHYDSIADCTGADDNATGVAGALEAARVLASTTHDRTIVIAFWDEEERGKLGSWHWTDATAAAGTEVVIHLVFEMIGYATDEPDTQTFPAGFELLFPEPAGTIAANEGRGDFIALIANGPAEPWAEAFEAHAAGTGLSAIPIVLTDGFDTASTTADLRRSDHEGSWAFGYPAIMVTDTSEFRYTGYHCFDGEDSVDRLDHTFATQTVASSVAVAALAASTDAPAPAIAPSDALRQCDLETNEGCDAGQKCATVYQAAGWYQVTCVDEASTTVGALETCTRPDGTVGMDTCEQGYFCAFWGKPAADPPERHCLAYCDASSDCGDAGACITYSGSLPSAGACAATCDPFADDPCGEGLHCIAERNTVEGPLAWACNRIQTTGAGELCSPGFDHCDEGLSCGYGEDGVARCGAPCDGDHPCPEGSTCQTVSNASPQHPTAGVCH